MRWCLPLLCRLPVRFGAPVVCRVTAQHSYSFTVAQEGATDGEAGLFSNTGAIFGIVIAALVLSLLAACAFRHCAVCACCMSLAATSCCAGPELGNRVCLYADIIYRKTIPDDFLVERSRHYYASYVHARIAFCLKPGSPLPAVQLLQRKLIPLLYPACAQKSPLNVEGRRKGG